MSGEVDDRAVRLALNVAQVAGERDAAVRDCAHWKALAGERAFPLVEGRCPTCGNTSLFLGAGGYVTCSWVKCSRPDHASDLLAGGAQ